MGKYFGDSRLPSYLLFRQQNSRRSRKYRARPTPHGDPIQALVRSVLAHHQLLPAERRSLAQTGVTAPYAIVDIVLFHLIPHGTGV